MTDTHDVDAGDVGLQSGITHRVNGAFIDGARSALLAEAVA